MMLIYVLIGIAAVYAAYYFGAKKNSSPARIAGQINKQVPGGIHSNGTSNDAYVHDDSEEPHKQHKSHGGCC